MLPEITSEDFSRALDEVAAAVLASAGVATPPVNVLTVARWLGLVVARGRLQAERARFVSLAARTSEVGRGSILLRTEPRLERRQWAVAHEIGEQAAHDVFGRLGVDPVEAPPTAREDVANRLAARLLLPRQWYHRDAAACDWDLFALKEQYHTASHELIVRRMLDFAPPVIISIFDQGQLAFRRSNIPGRPPRLSPVESACRRAVAESQAPCTESRFGWQVQGWPVYEPAWRREILRCHITVELDEESSADSPVTWSSAQ